MSDLTRVGKLWTTLRWLPAYLWQRLSRGQLKSRPVHLMIALADHFEPAVIPRAHNARADRAEQERRMQRWCREYPRVVDRWRDADGFPFRHTYFYPAEQYDRGLVARLADHCQAGWGEVEIHLHHGQPEPDTPENTRRTLLEFRDALAGHGCLARLDGAGPPRYAFVHGNWALANSNSGRFCGVDEEMQILAETGCYADLSLPAAPNPAQVAKINSLYECGMPLNHRAPHRRGRDLASGRPPRLFPLIIQGPLMLDFSRWASGLPVPSIENGDLTLANPPTMRRLRLWQQAAIAVRGRPDWIFIKLHCHGMDPREEEVMLGSLLQHFLRELVENAQRSGEYYLHFVTAREMVNIALAACDGRAGTPADFRDYRFHPPAPSSQC